MNLCSKSQTKLYGLDEELNELINLYNNSKLPNKILLSGEKGIGKCTLAYHLINYILSNNEENPYNTNDLQINADNHSFKLIQNNSNPNFDLIDVNSEKKSIEINQIRSLINNLNKSSFNSKPRFILIDNIEFLNVNSINALLKILEEPNENTYFILINNNKKILSTLLSRCLNFKISLSNEKVNLVNKLLFGDDIKNLINSDILDYYHTPGKIYDILEFSKEKGINLRTINLKEFLSLIIKESYYKNDNKIKIILYDYLELFLLKKVSITYLEIFSYFLKKINNVKKFNLNEESLFLEIDTKLLNG